MSERYSIDVLEGRRDELNKEKKNLQAELAAANKKMKLIDKQIESINKGIRIIKSSYGYPLEDDL